MGKNHDQNICNFLIKRKYYNQVEIDLTNSNDYQILCNKLENQIM